MNAKMKATVQQIVVEEAIKVVQPIIDRDVQMGLKPILYRSCSTVCCELTKQFNELFKTRDLPLKVRGTVFI